MKLWPTLGVAFLLITSMRLSWSLGRENARNEAQASTLKSTVDTLNIISAGVQDMQQVLAQLRAENQQRNQDGEVRREQLRNDIAKMNAPTLCLTLVLLTGCAGTQNAPVASAVSPAYTADADHAGNASPFPDPPTWETSEYGATAFWMHWKPVTRINGPLLNWIRE